MIADDTINWQPSATLANLRLLAAIVVDILAFFEERGAGSGAIYQICKAFRQGEVGQLHNPEFTMLEWCRPDYDHHALMDEMDKLLQRVLGEVYFKGIGRA
jgi:elongation factor P--beta-lysine ligase